MPAADDEHATTLQSRLEDATDDASEEVEAVADAREPSIGDPVALLRHLDVSGQFHRDGPVGRLYHLGQVSLRENVPNDCLHVAVDGNRVLAHIDVVSPLTEDAHGRSRYSATRTVAHNLAGAAHDLVSLLRGRQGDHASVLDCEWVSDADASAAGSEELLEPRTAAWSVHLEARVAGSLDPARLRAALGDVPDDRVVVVECPDDDALEAARTRLVGLPVPIRPAPSLRACLARHAEGDVLMLNFNHAAADGFGALDVLRRLASAYAGDGPTVAELDWLAAKDLPVRPSTAPKPVLVRVYRAAVERVRDALARPVQLVPDAPQDADGYGFHLHALSAAETRRVGRGDGSPSDRHVPMAALHRAIGEWNRRRGAARGTIGILAPTDLRSEDWDERTVGNFSVTMRVSTSRRERRSARAALRATARQIARAKRTRSGTALIAALRRSGLLALWAKQSVVVLQPLEHNRMVDSAMLCNLGWVDEAPSFGPEAGEIRELWFSPPARTPLCLCLGTVTLCGRLHVTLRYPHRLFGPDAARRFAECYVDRLRDVAERS